MRTVIVLEEIGHLLALPAGALNEDCVAVSKFRWIARLVSADMVTWYITM